MDRKKMRRNNSVGIKTPFWIAIQGIKKWPTQPRMYVVFLSICIFLWTQIKDVRAYAMLRGMGVSCWFFPFLFTSNICMMILYFGLILVYCNAPFLDQQQLFVMLRSGRKKWFMGQILYIILTSVIYFAVVAVISMLEFLPYLGFSMEWGDILREAVQNPMATNTYLIASERILEKYEPVQAFLIVFLINTGVGILMGLMIFLINLYKSRTYGSVVAFAVVLVSDLVSLADGMMINNWMRYISPASWTNLTLYIQQARRFPIAYVFIFLITTNVVLSVFIMIRAKNYNIESAEEI